MKYIVVGAGPTGLSLTYYLAKGGHEVTLIEKEDQLGGSWNSQWHDDKYFTENSPRVLIFSQLTRKFLGDLGLDKQDFANVYGNKLQTFFKFINFGVSNLSLKDYFIGAYSFIKHHYNKSNENVQDWLDSNNFSEKFKKAMKITSIVICDRPDKTNLTDFFGAITDSNSDGIKQMREPNKWHEILEAKLKTKYGVKIFKNTPIEKVLTNKNRVVGVSTKNQKYYADRVVLATQSSGLHSILNQSNELVKNNWMSYSLMKNWIENTYYSGFSFQLNFKQKIAFPKKWLTFSFTDWTIIILPVSDWLESFSKDQEIQTTWSCCIVDMDTPSKFLKKTANQCKTKEEVLDECLRQIKSIHKIPNPKKVTTSKGLRRINGIWTSLNTGFSRNINSYLPIQGNIEGLFALGCFTKPDTPHISHFETAIMATKNFLNKYQPEIEDLEIKNNNKNKIFLGFLLVIVLIILNFKNE